MDSARKTAILSGIIVSLYSAEYWEHNYQKWHNAIYSIDNSSVTKVGTSIKGKVIDSNCVPIIGATINVKGTRIGAISDVDGLFELHGVSSRDIICISFLGYETQSICVGNRSQVLVVLQDDAERWWDPIASTAKEDGIGAIAAASSCLAIGPFSISATALGAMVASLSFCLQNI